MKPKINEFTVSAAWWTLLLSLATLIVLIMYARSINEQVDDAPSFSVARSPYAYKSPEWRKWVIETCKEKGITITEEDLK